MISVILFLFSFPSKSQVSIGLTGGFNFANMNLVYNNKLLDSRLLVSIHLGSVLQCNVSKSFGIQSGLIFSGKGWTYETTAKNAAVGSGTITQRVKPIYWELPLDAVWKISLRDRKLSFFGGTYFSVGVGGKVENEVSGFSNQYSSDDVLKSFKLEKSSDINYGTSAGKFMRRFDYGLDTGIGMDYGKAQLNLKYQFGLYNLDSQYKSGNFTRNSLFSINMVYLF